MAHIRLRGVSAKYELLTVRDYNLKRRLADLTGRRSEPPRSIHALRSIDLDLEDGMRVGLIGANGAGKSTLLAVMAGLLPPTTGSVRVEGRVLALLGGASAGLDQEASGRDNIVSLGVQLGETPQSMRRLVEEILDFSGLGSRGADPVYSYSAGMQARLRFSILTSLSPDVLLIDEGIGMADAAFAEKAAERLASFVSGAGIVVLASHGDALLRQQCDLGLWLDTGVLRAKGRLEELLGLYHASYAGNAHLPASR